MNFRRGFFRLWLFVSSIYLVVVATFAFPIIQVSEVQSERDQFVRTLCNEQKGIGGTDYTYNRDWGLDDRSKVTQQAKIDASVNPERFAREAAIAEAEADAARARAVDDARTAELKAQALKAEREKIQAEASAAARRQRLADEAPNPIVEVPVRAIDNSEPQHSTSTFPSLPGIFNTLDFSVKPDEAHNSVYPECWYLPSSFRKFWPGKAYAKSDDELILQNWPITENMPNLDGFRETIYFFLLLAFGLPAMALWIGGFLGWAVAGFRGPT